MLPSKQTTEKAKASEKVGNPRHPLKMHGRTQTGCVGVQLPLNLWIYSIPCLHKNTVQALLLTIKR